MIQPTSSGMVTHSAVNPTDEIPVGPQVYPYGTPKLAETNVNPYLSTTYQKAITAIPTATNVEVVQPVAAVQEVYQTPPVISRIGYQKVVRYKPVTTTTLVPQVFTSYVEMPANSVVNPVVPAPAVAAPVVANPVLTGSVVGNPVLTGSVAANPVLTGSVVANPVLTGSVVGNPVLTGSVVTNPVLTGSVVGNPLLTGSVVTNPLLTGSVVGNPLLTGSVVGNPVVPPVLL